MMVLGAEAYFHEMRRVDSFYSLFLQVYKTLVVIDEMFDVENEDNFVFLIQVSVDGVEVEDYS